jgi:hypothetical protein
MIWEIIVMPISSYTVLYITYFIFSYMSKLMCLNPTCWDRSIDLRIGIAMLTPNMFVAGKYDSGTLSKLP